MLKKLIFILFICFFLHAEDKAKMVKDITSYLILEDKISALVKAKEALRLFPQEKEVRLAYINALCANNMEFEAICAYSALVADFAQEVNDRDILEKVCWSVLTKSSLSLQYSTRFSSLVGSYLTHDSMAVNILLKMMDDSNAIIRSMAVRFACDYQDDILKDKIADMLEKEKIWLVRLELIKAAGKMRIKDKSSFLKKLLSNSRISYEEKNLAIFALVEMYDSVEKEELLNLFNSAKANLRILFCELAVRFEMADVKEQIKALVSDPILDVSLEGSKVYIMPKSTGVGEITFVAFDMSNLISSRLRSDTESKYFFKFNLPLRLTVYHE